MLQLCLSLLPQGDPRHPVSLGRVEIYNDESGDNKNGNYIASLFHPDGTLARRVRLCAQPRTDPPFLLAARALALLFPS